MKILNAIIKLLGFLMFLGAFYTGTIMKEYAAAAYYMAFAVFLHVLSWEEI